MENNEALTPLEVAERLRIAKNTVYELIKRGELRGYKVGKKVRVDLKDVEAYKNSTQSRGRSDPVNEPIRAEYVRDVPELGNGTILHSGQPLAPSAAGSFVLCGQDLILDVLAQRVESRPNGVRILRSYLGSYNGLYALYQGAVQAATAHLWDGMTDTYNAPYFPHILPGERLLVIRLARRRVGYYVRAGNPQSLSSWEDLGRSGLTFANRERGSGVRVLVDERLRLLAIDQSSLRGYSREYSTHLTVASAVARGEADVGVGSEKASRQVDGIEFIPLQEECYDLVLRQSDESLPGYSQLVDEAQSPGFRQELIGLGGYSCDETGQIIRS